VPLLASLVLAFVVAACAHPAHRILLVTADETAAFVRLTYQSGGATLVYRLQGSTLGTATSGSGAFDGSVEFLDRSCDPLAKADVVALGDLTVALDGAGNVSTSAVEPSTTPPDLVQVAECLSP
jgi:hypothetical protein